MEGTDLCARERRVLSAWHYRRSKVKERERGKGTYSEHLRNNLV